MADISYTPNTLARDNAVGGFFARLVQKLEQIASTNARVRMVERLNAMSDAELADRGLKRDEIVHHVFRDVMYY